MNYHVETGEVRIKAWIIILIATAFFAVSGTAFTAVLSRLNDRDVADSAATAMVSSDFAGYRTLTDTALGRIERNIVRICVMQKIDCEQGQ